MMARGAVRAAARPVAASIAGRFCEDAGASGPTTLLSDTFTGAAGNLTAHTPDVDVVGGGWSVAGASGPGSAALDGAGRAVCNTTTFVFCWADCGAADVTATSTTSTIGGSELGAVANVGDQNNCWIFVRLAGDLILRERVASANTNRGSVAQALTLGDTLGIRTAGDTVEGLYNGVSVASYTTAGRSLKTNTSAGFYFHPAGAVMDAVEVTG